jgi:hypothetical protein
MIDKHYKVAMILLTLPLSFGGGNARTTAKTIGAADSKNLLTLKSATGSHGFRTTDVAGRFGASPGDFAGGLGHAPGTFVSSFNVAGTTRDANCLNATLEIENPQVEWLNGDCLPSGGEKSIGGNSNMGFPMYDSSKNFDTSQYSRVAGGSGTFGPAGGVFGGSGGGSSTGPTSTPVATPEPGSFVLLAGGLLMLAGLVLRRGQRKAA